MTIWKTVRQSLTKPLTTASTIIKHGVSQVTQQVHKKVHLKVLLGILATILAYKLFNQVNVFNKRRECWLSAVTYARERKKPILSYGAGNQPNFIADEHADIQEQTIFPSYTQISEQADTSTKGWLPYHDNQYSAVICFETLEHVDNPREVIKELQRVGERVYITVPSPYTLTAWLHPGHEWVFHDGNVYKNHPVIAWGLFIIAIITVYSVLTS